MAVVVAQHECAQSKVGRDRARHRKRGERPQSIVKMVSHVERAEAVSFEPLCELRPSSACRLRRMSVEAGRADPEPKRLWVQAPSDVVATQHGPTCAWLGEQDEASALTKHLLGYGAA